MLPTPNGLSLFPYSNHIPMRPHGHMTAIFVLYQVVIFDALILHWPINSHKARPAVKNTFDISFRVTHPVAAQIMPFSFNFRTLLIFVELSTRICPDYAQLLYVSEWVF